MNYKELANQARLKEQSYNGLLQAIVNGLDLERKYKEGWERMPWEIALKSIAIQVPLKELRIQQ